MPAPKDSNLAEWLGEMFDREDESILKDNDTVRIETGFRVESNLIREYVRYGEPHIEAEHLFKDEVIKKENGL